MRCPLTAFRLEAIGPTPEWWYRVADTQSGAAGVSALNIGFEAAVVWTSVFTGQRVIGG